MYTEFSNGTDGKEKRKEHKLEVLPVLKKNRKFYMQMHDESE
jgi:hypothetical protein